MLVKGKTAHEYVGRHAGANSGTEDELSTNMSPRVTPGPSIQVLQSESMQTPYANLRQLAGIMKKPSTPLRRASTTQPASARRVAMDFTQSQSSTPRARKTPQPVPLRKGASTTRHTVRALQRRTAKLTPAHDRRRSGRMQRETPRDVLRNLSRVLAQTSQPTKPSPLSIPAEEEQDEELGNDADITKPGFSLNLEDKGEEDDEDSFHMHRPRLSLPLDDGDHTERSIELGRRAISEQPSGRLSRGSLGTLRMSDRLGDTTTLQLDAIAETSAADSVLRLQIDNIDADAGDFNAQIDPMGDIHGLRRAVIEETNIDQTLRSDLGPWNLIESDGDMTFTLAPPSDRESIHEAGTSNGYGDLDDLQAEELLVVSTGSASRNPSKPRVRKTFKTSRRGIAYPPLPTGVVKSLSSTFARSVGYQKANIGKESLAAIMEASDWFFDQIGENLGTYAEHAGRKKIDERDVSTVMKR